MIFSHRPGYSQLEKGTEEALTAQFVLAIAVSGTIAPKLYIRLRKVQSEQRSSNNILLTDMSFKDGLPTVYSPVRGHDPEAEHDFIVGSNRQHTNDLAS